MKRAREGYGMGLMDDKRMIKMLIAVIVAGVLAVSALIWAACRPEREVLELPAAEDVVACYWIPDVTRPYEQVWLGGEELEAALEALAELEFSEAAEPDGGKMVACLVVATNEEQITIHVDGDGGCWVFDEIKGRRRGTRQ